MASLEGYKLRRTELGRRLKDFDSFERWKGGEGLDERRVAHPSGERTATGNLKQVTLRRGKAEHKALIDSTWNNRRRAALSAERHLSQSSFHHQRQARAYGEAKGAVDNFTPKAAKVISQMRRVRAAGAAVGVAGAAGAGAAFGALERGRSGRKPRYGSANAVGRREPSAVQRASVDRAKAEGDRYRAMGY